MSLLLQFTTGEISALDNCWGFVDGTGRPFSRPGQNQKYLYNGHKEVHVIKFESIATPSGLVANLFVPVDGKTYWDVS